MYYIKKLNLFIGLELSFFDRMHFNKRQFVTYTYSFYWLAILIHVNTKHGIKYTYCKFGLWSSFFFSLFFDAVQWAGQREWVTAPALCLCSDPSGTEASHWQLPHLPLQSFLSLSPLPLSLSLSVHTPPLPFSLFFLVFCMHSASLLTLLPANGGGQASQCWCI